ncbi:MAG: hypothetical protein QGG39_06335, partial [Candidatus Poribacteria bacterium]|nr:hypothetical protein [Candidatus Poribacteria bacterium]
MHRSIYHIIWTEFLIYFCLFGPTALASFPTQTQTIGKGETGIAIFEDANSLKNPAGLAEFGQYHLGFERSPSHLFQILETNHLSTTFPLSDKLAVGLSWSQIGLDDSELLVSKNLFCFSYSYLLLGWLSVGTNLKHLMSSSSLDGMLRGSEIGWGADVGVLVHLRNFDFPLWPKRELFDSVQSKKRSQWRSKPSWTFGLVMQDLVDLGIKPGLNSGTWIRHDTGVVEKYQPTQLLFGISCRPSSKWQLSADLSDRLNFGLEFRPYRGLSIRTGLYRLLGVEVPLRSTVTLGASIKYKTLGFDVAYVSPPTLPDTTYARFSLNLDRRTLPVRIEQIRLENLYPVHYNFYAQPNREAETEILQNPNTPTILTTADLNRYYPLASKDTIGRIWLKNESQKTITVRIELYMADLVDKNGTEVASEVVLPPMKRVSVPLRQMVLARKAIYLRQMQTAEAKVKVTQVGGTAHRLKSTQLVFYGNHSTRLDDIAKLGSFISFDDPAVRSFIQQVRQDFGSEIESADLPADLSLAVALFEALYGLAYTSDPNIPFESGTVDEITYPHEMLTRLSAKNADVDSLTSTSDGTDTVFGDCDDSTTLYCALLESAGIKTALIQLPNHVLMAFQVGNISIDIAQMMNLPDIYLPINGQVWIPIETTQVKSGFITAWESALEQLQRMEVTNSVTVEEAWRKYGA